MQLILHRELAFVTATLTYGRTSIQVADVLVDTGAASTVINADVAAEGGRSATGGSRLRRLRGVGGHEHVFVRRVDHLAVGANGLDAFEVEIGEMDYGFELGGILGMDFLRAAGAVIDLGRATIEFSTTA